MALNPLEIKIAAIGGAQAKDALRDIGQAYQELARVQQLAAKTTEDAWSNSFRRMQRQFEEFNRALGKGKSGSGPTGSASSGSTGSGSGLSSLAAGSGPVGIIAKIGDILGSAIDFAANALKKFGTFLLNDIILPSLKAGKAAAQLANTFEGASSKDVKSAMLGFREKYAGVDSDVIKQTFRIAGERTGGNLGHAKTITDLALKAGEAYGQDPTKIADMLAVKRMALPQSISEDHFRQIAAAELMVGKSSGFGMTGMASAKGRITQMAKKLSGGVDEGTALHDVELTNMIAHGAINFGGKGANKAISGLNSLFKDLEQEAPNLEREGIRVIGKSSQGTTKINDLSEIIPKLLQSVGGDVMKLGAGPKGGTTLGSRPLGKGFSSASVDALRAFGFTDVYQKAEQQKKGSGAEAVKKMIEEMAKPTGDAMKQLEKDFKRVDSQPVVQFEQAMRQFKDTLAMAVMPTVNEVLVLTIKNVKPAFDDMIKWIRDIIKDIKPEDISNALKAVAKAMATAFYHVINIFNKKLPGLNVSDEDMESLRKFTGAEKTTDAASSLVKKDIDYIKKGWEHGNAGEVLAGVANMPLAAALSAGGYVSGKAKKMYNWVAGEEGGSSTNANEAKELDTPTGSPTSDNLNKASGALLKAAQWFADSAENNPNRSLPMSSPIRADSSG